MLPADHNPLVEEAALRLAEAGLSHQCFDFRPGALIPNFLGENLGGFGPFDMMDFGRTRRVNATRMSARPLLKYSKLSPVFS